MNTVQPVSEATRVGFVSDLHLFSSRSTAHEHEEAIRRVAGEVDLMVLGGDLFDFRWSRVGSAAATTAASLDWLDRIIDTSPAVRWAFLFGNHDGDAVFLRGLRKWATRRSDFEIAGDVLRVGDTVFLHGDVIEGGKHVDGFDRYRRRWADKSTAGHWSSRAYDAVVAVRAHKVAAAAAHRRRITCRRLLDALRPLGHDYTEGLRRVVFGHTHRHLDGFYYDGVRFYNCGAAIRWLPFCPIVLTVEPSDDAPAPPKPAARLTDRPSSG